MFEKQKRAQKPVKPRVPSMPNFRLQSSWPLVGVAGGLILSLAGCGGGAAPAPPSPAPSGGTPAGNYNLTVTAYTVSGATSTASIPVTVQ